MSPSATRNSRAVKHSAKTAESKSTSKKVVPSARRAAPAAKPAVRTKPEVKTARAAAAPTKPARKPEPKTRSSKPVEVAPLKKSLTVDVHKPKKKTEDVTPEEKLESVPKTRAPKAESDAEAAPKKTIKAKASKVELPPPEEEDEEETSKSTRGRKAGGDSKEKSNSKAGRPPKMKPLDPIDEFIADDMPAPDEIEEEDAVIPEDLSELDPLDLPLALLDPELVEVPRPAGPPRPKPKPRVERNPKQCASCGQSFTWLSVDQLCFNCLKKKLAAKKREDESYGGYTAEAEEDDSD